MASSFNTPNKIPPNVIFLYALTFSRRRSFESVTVLVVIAMILRKTLFVNGVKTMVLGRAYSWASETSPVNAEKPRKGESGSRKSLT